MISVTSSKNQRLRAARPNTVLVLEPPRHTRWPLVFLGPGKHMIGTSADAAIRIDAEGVQPHHALILVGDQKILLKALDPKTWVNDGAASETMLRPGDRISIGPITFQARPATARELEDYQPPEPIEDEEPPTAASSNRATIAAPEPVPAPSQRAPLKPEILAAHDRPEPPPVPVVVEEEIRSSPETTFQEIHRHLEALNEPIVVPQIAPTRATMEIEARQKAREEQLNQLAGELARQSQRLRDQTARIAERETELERKQSAIAEENERLITAAQSTRQELAEEHARQMALWQDWDSAYKRTSEELKLQLQAIEERRTELHAESERLGVERLETQRLQAEYETERRNVAAERVRATTEVGDLHTQRTALETERRQLLLSIQEREAALASERRALTVTQDEMLATRQQFEHERTLLATERSAESLRREQDIHEQTLARIRLTDQETELQTKQLELAAILRKHEEDWVELDRARSLVEAERAEIHELHARIEQLESELDSSRQSYHDLQTALERAQFDSERTKAELDAALRQYESDRADRERSLADSDRTEADELKTRVNQLQSELEFSRQSQHDLRAAMDQMQLEADRNKVELEDRQHAFAQQQAEIDALHLQLQEEQEATAATRAELVAALEARSGEHDLSPPAALANEPSTSVPAAVERLMGIVPEHDDRPSLGLPNDDSLPSYFGHGGKSQPPNPPSTTSPEILFSASDLPSEHNTERSDSGDDLGYGLAQLSTQPMRVEPSEDGGPHCDFDSDESPLTTDEILASTLVDEIAAEPSPDVNRTLTEVNEQFGYVSSLLNHFLGPLTQELPGSVKSTDISEPLPNSLTPIDNHDLPEVPYRASEDSVPGLRAQLAEMFDLPENPRNAVESMEQSGFGLDLTNDSSQSIDRSRLGELSSDTNLSGEKSDTPLGSLLSEIMRIPGIDSPSPSQTEQETLEEEESDGEDPWEKRLRELSRSTEPASPPPIPKSESESFANEDETLSHADDEFSVEAQLARLLGRPYRSVGNAPEKPKPEKPNVEQAADPAAISNPDLEAALSLQSVDRSHLSEAPKHKTDRSALRDETQSFREVAQISARTALAKHSWNNLKNEFYFISGLTAVSSIATAWFLGTFLVGWETDPWKGVTCAIATVLCSHRMVTSSAKLNQWHRANRKNKTQPAPSAPVSPPEITKPTK